MSRPTSEAVSADPAAGVRTGEPTTRRLTPEDARESYLLGAEAFGYTQSPPDPLPDPTRGGRIMMGTFVDGQLVARGAALGYRSWWGGREVPQAAVASVVVRMEERGAGMLTPLFSALTDAARERGDVIATLYPTAPGIYRRFGFETVASYDQVELTTRDLLAARAPEGVEPAGLRRGDAGDLAAVQAVWTRWARQHDGPVTRTGPHFPHDEESYGAELGSASLTLAVEGDEVTGYAVWRRRDGYHDGLTDVDEVIALTPGAHVALLQAIGTSYSVAPRTTLWTSGLDVVRTFLPSTTWRGIDCRPVMLGVLDVVGAFEARGYPAHLVADLRFAVTGDEPVAGTYRLRVDGGRATCERLEGQGADGIRVLTPRGLALAWSGATPASGQRAAGLLTGPVADDPLWDALPGGRQVHVRDYF